MRGCLLLQMLELSAEVPDGIGDQQCVVLRLMAAIRMFWILQNLSILNPNSSPVNASWLLRAFPSAIKQLTPQTNNKPLNGKYKYGIPEDQ